MGTGDVVIISWRLLSSLSATVTSSGQTVHVSQGHGAMERRSGKDLDFSMPLIKMALAVKNLQRMRHFNSGVDWVRCHSHPSAQ